MKNAEVTVTLRFLSCHVGQHVRFGPARTFSLHAAFVFCVLPQMFVAGTATPVC